jgi:hypothetical protein
MKDKPILFNPTEQDAESIEELLINEKIKKLFPFKVTKTGLIRLAIKELKYKYITQ